MRTSIQDIIITIFGAVSSFLTALLLLWIEREWNHFLYSFMLWFVIPVGAIIFGFIAASGYYVGARLFNHRPHHIILLNMVAISVGTYFLIQYLDYIYFSFEGKPISDYLSFWQYWDFSLSNQEVQFRVGRRGIKAGDAVELGNWGYMYAVIQIIGFAVGGFCVYAYLAAQTYCDKCSLYLSKQGTIIRYADDPNKFGTFLYNVAEFTKENKLSEIISLHAVEGGTAEAGSEHHLSTSIELKYCKGCNKLY